MKVFPHILVRIGGGSFEQIEKLVPAKTKQLAQSILEEKDKCSLLVEDINKTIYQLMPTITSPEVQKKLLNIKRDVFNKRDVQISKIDAISEHIPELIYSPLLEYIKSMGKINELLQQGEQIFDKDLGHIRKHFKDMVNAEKFKQGLLLSSGTLLKNIPNYLNTPTDQFRKKEFQTENGLIKYITRMYTKTSPFSTFTNLAMGQIGCKKEEAAIIEEGIPYTSHIRINNRIYQYIKILLFKIPVVYRQFLLRPNPTLTKKNDNYVYLTNHNNKEAFQSMPVSPILDLITELTTTKKEGFIYKELTETVIASKHIDASAKNIEGYINQLLEYGFFEFNLGVSGIDHDWDKKLVEKLLPLAKENKVIKNLIYALEQTGIIANQYGKAAVQERRKLLVSAYELIRGACMKLHEKAGLPEEERLRPEEYKKLMEQKHKAALKEKEKEDEKKKESKENNKEQAANKEDEKDDVFKLEGSTYFFFKPEQIFYEDTSALISPAFDEVNLNELTASLHKLFQAVPGSIEKPFEHDNMQLFFINKYGKDASVDLYRFYEDYYREYKIPEEKRKQKAIEEARKKEKKELPAKKDSPAPISKNSSAERLNHWREKFSAIVMENLNASELPDEINISLEQVQKANEPAHDKATFRQACSYGVFVQLYRDNTHLRGVLNMAVSGYGRFLSRFLNLFDENITEDVRKWNESDMGNSLFAENCDASYLNANIHPPLMPYEIWMPGGHNSLPAEQQIPITALKVSWNESENQLQLIHEGTKKRVFVFDLGFQAEGGRSELFKLLNIISNKNVQPLHLKLVNTISDLYKKNNA